jgi:hypothetical protein
LVTTNTFSGTIFQFLQLLAVLRSLISLDMIASSSGGGAGISNRWKQYKIE